MWPAARRVRLRCAQQKELEDPLNKRLIATVVAVVMLVLGWVAGVQMATAQTFKWGQTPFFSLAR